MFSANVAVADLASSILTVHVELEPVHAPLQPVNVEPVDAVAVSVAEVLMLRDSEQSLPQLMPTGELVTVPLPVPVLATDN